MNVEFSFPATIFLSSKLKSFSVLPRVHVGELQNFRSILILHYKPEHNPWFKNWKYNPDIRALVIPKWI